MTSESAEPSMAGYSDGSTASTSSRFTLANSRIIPLWTQSQRPWRKGWQLVCWTAVPVEARMWARNSGEATWPASSRRLRSLQAGPTSRNTPGVSPEVYQPTPNPSPLVVVAPIRACMLWSISECAGL